MLDKTQPTRRMDRMQSVQVVPARRRPRLQGCCLWPMLLLVLCGLYFFAPVRTNLLLLGTDNTPERGAVGRTDTIILATVVPLRPYVGLLSIPRDLWVTVPGIGEQRINTAYFFAEASASGSGPGAVLETIRTNFGVPVRYYAVVHMGGLSSIVDALGGVDLVLSAPLGGWPAGVHHLDGARALDFVRDRSSSDDFSRMVRAQLLLTGIARRVMEPARWRDLPGFGAALTRAIDTNIPLWQWPRLLFAFLRASLFGIDSQTITREMVTPFQTAGGAQVLAPDWQILNPFLRGMFGG